MLDGVGGSRQTKGWREQETQGPAVKLGRASGPHWLPAKFDFENQDHPLPKRMQNKVRLLHCGISVPKKDRGAEGGADRCSPVPHRRPSGKAHR